MDVYDEVSVNIVASLDAPVMLSCVDDRERDELSDV